MTTEPTDAEAEAPDELRPRFFDVAEIEGQTIAQIAGDDPDAQWMLDLFGRDLLTKILVMTPSLTVLHETAPPGEQVKPHRHGTHQCNFMLRGELIFGSTRITPGMGFFTPDMLYSWRAGDEGAEWIEIHGGTPGIHTDRPA